MSVFSEFAKFYDLVHQDKDYEKESFYVDSLIRKYKPETKTILDIGCGTGNYSFAMQTLGYEVKGIDASPQMVAIAQEKPEEEEKKKSKPSFCVARMEEYKSDLKSDAVICLFYSLCYQTTDDLIRQSLRCFKEQLHKNGILVFDFWHKNGVLSQGPKLKIQRYRAKNLEITKLAEPSVDTSVDCVGIDYTFFVENEDGDISKFTEYHKVRYLHKELLIKLLKELNFKVELIEGWMTNQSLKENDWAGIIVARSD